MTNIRILSTITEWLQCFCCLALKLMILGPFPARPCIMLGQQAHSSAPFHAWFNCKVCYLKLTRITYRTNGMPPTGRQTYRGARSSAKLELGILKKWTDLVWAMGFNGRPSHLTMKWLPQSSGPGIRQNALLKGDQECFSAQWLTYPPLPFKLPKMG